MSGRDDLDALLEARAAQFARPPDPVVIVRDRALRLGLGSDRVLLPATAALAVAPLLSIAAIPNAPPHVAGLTARRGRAIPVFHLRVLLGLPLRELPETSRIVVLATEGDPALAVDIVEDDDWPAPGAIRPAPDTMTSAARHLLCGVTEDGRLCLDAEALFSTPLLTVDVGPRARDRDRDREREREPEGSP
jgi:purine-binding chemotaxis protein CheW